MAVVSARPPTSDLVKQSYNAFVYYDEAGNLEVETLYSKEYETMVRMLLADPEAPVPVGMGERGIGVNIIGFSMLFITMYALWNLTLYAEEKEQGQLLRLISTPASLWGYFAAHCLYGLLVLTPQFLLLAALNFLGWDLGFSIWQHGVFILLLGFFGTSLAFILNTLIKKPDNASMLGNAIVVLTTVLSGGFYSFTRGNSFLDWIVRLLPQKRVIDFAMHLEAGVPGQGTEDIIYVCGFCLLLLGASLVVLRSRYVRKVKHCQGSLV